MKTALRNIRDELGPNAFVLSTRRINRKDKFGRLKTLIEVSAASDVVQVSNSKQDAAPVGAGSADGARAFSRRSSSSYYGEGGAMAKSARDSDMVGSLQSQVDQLKSELALLGGQHPAQAIESIKEEIVELKDLVEFATDQWAEQTVNDYGPILGALFRRLKRSDVDHRLATKLIAITSRELAKCPKIDEKESLKVLFDVMKRQTLVSGSIELLESGPKTVVLIGPTGVGKTTTLAKIAAQYSMFRKKKVGLLTIDTFRIGAVEQLRTYANILELPLKVANTPEQMRKFVSDYSGMDLVLIDTGGRSQKDKAKMAELLNFVGGRDDMYYQVHLLLSGATKNRDLVEITREFGKVPTDYVIFTKLDECNSFGGILNEILWTQKPASYLTTGQSVPDDIEVAEAGRIVELILTSTFQKKVSGALGKRAK